MRVAVLGANGQLGTDVVAAFRTAGHEVVELTHAEIQLEDEDSVRAALEGVELEAVINCAAFHDVPRCESEVERAFAVNAVGALNVARTAETMGASAVYFSTDYVFDGAKTSPYLEGDLPRPLNVYGCSKLAGEHLTLAFCRRGLVVRISGIYGRVPSRVKGENFVTKIVSLAASKPVVRVVTDEVLAPTPTREIAERMPELLAAGAEGIVHLACEGGCSWYEFTREIFEVLSISTPLEPTTTAEFPSPVRRPAFSVLESSRLGELGVTPVPDWRVALRGFLSARYEDERHALDRDDCGTPG
jgi:dTDP-4-dehydrorhamnose reductase